MSLTSHDEFLHLGYPRNSSLPWKENYYFNFFDRKAEIMGLFHCTFMRDKEKLRIVLYYVVDGETQRKVEYLDLPQSHPKTLKDNIVAASDHFEFEVLEPYKRHRVKYEKDDTVISLDFTARFDVYDFGQSVADEGDKALDVLHYEQGMFVEGKFKLGEEVRSIKCLGHRDHTWGFRDESGLGGWHWVAIQCERSTWNLTLVKRSNSPDSVSGFVSYPDRAHAVIGIEVLQKDVNDRDEPVKVRYQVELDNGDRVHITAVRFYRLASPDDSKETAEGVIFHENFSEFIIEETGDTGLGVDEHMIIPESLIRNKLNGTAG